ncbi:hypothetical protein E2C01_026635 [Portunus trituberculatus]|uniref:Uncharacterized protein n=1 Tax=Portunus trituberculatus TaxID=210409 RepID=A0A5B7EGN2_PORTR|nr:hypothetical protein [Portunus trituberculatus]
MVGPRGMDRREPTTGRIIIPVSRVAASLEVFTVTTVPNAPAASLTRWKILGSPSKDVENEDGGKQNHQKGGEPRPHQPCSPVVCLPGY